MCWILGIREVELFPEGLFLQKDTLPEAAVSRHNQTKLPMKCAIGKRGKNTLNTAYQNQLFKAGPRGIKGSRPYPRLRPSLPSFPPVDGKEAVQTCIPILTKTDRASKQTSIYGVGH